MQNNPLESRFFQETGGSLRGAFPRRDPSGVEKTALPEDSFKKGDLPPLDDKGEVQGFSKASSNGLSRGLPEYERAIDEAINLLSSAKDSCGQIKNDLYGVDREVRNAESDLSSTRYPITRVMMDTDKTDVSHEGYTLDMYFRNADRNIGDANRDVEQADREFEVTRKNLDNSHLKVDSLEKELSGVDSVKYGAVIGHLRAARSHIARAQSDSLKTDRDLGDINRQVDDADRELTWTSTYTNQIKFDRPGQNVSSAGHMLDGIVRRAESDLRYADNSVSYTQSDIMTIEDSTRGAIASLRSARSELGNVQ